MSPRKTARQKVLESLTWDEVEQVFYGLSPKQQYQLAQEFHGKTIPPVVESVLTRFHDDHHEGAHRFAEPCRSVRREVEL